MAAQDQERGLQRRLSDYFGPGGRAAYGFAGCVVAIGLSREILPGVRPQFPAARTRGGGRAAATQTVKRSFYGGSVCLPARKVNQWRPTCPWRLEDG